MLLEHHLLRAAKLRPIRNFARLANSSWSGENQFKITGEARNLTPLAAKPILPRVSHGTKIVFSGGLDQMDNPYVDSASHGFNYVVSRCRRQAVSAHVEPQRGERSELAGLAANLL